MPSRNNAARVAKEWIAKAENDLKNATHTLKLGTDCPTDTVCFRAQQCVEKYLKAFLADLNADARLDALDLALFCDYWLERTDFPQPRTELNMP